MQQVDDEDIAGKLDKLIGLFAVALVENKKEQKDQIRLLTLAGLAPIRIADILGTSGNTVRGAIAKLRKAKQLPKRREPHAKE